MKKKRMMKAQAIILAACLFLSTFDMTAFATTSSPDSTQMGVDDTGTEDVTETADTTNSTDTSNNTETASSTDATSNTETTSGTDASSNTETASSTDATNNTETASSTDETSNTDATSVTDTTNSAGTTEDSTDETNNTETTNTTDNVEETYNEDTTTVEQSTENIKTTEDIDSNSNDSKTSVDEPMGYNDVDDLIIPSIQDGSTFESQYGSETLPSAYSSFAQGYTTPIRNQNPWGACWSFAAMGMAETNLVKKGLADNTLNLSELQLAYFFYHTVADPLGNTTGDSTEALTDSYLEQGGNSIFTTFALANWTGAALETQAPYESAAENMTLDSGLAYNDAFHMQNAYWINMTDGRDYIKTMIKNYGAVASSYYQSTTYYNSSTYAYYKNGSYGANHAIIIVGWDDNFDKTKFNTAPSSNGAWLVKNSWGDSFGDSGYFWISYEDAAFNDVDNSKAFVFDFESAYNYDHNYQYDGSYGANAFGVYSGGSIANIFIANGNSSVAEQIDAVSFALYDANVNYSIQIYTDITNSANPTSGTAALLTPKTGSTTFAGYYTVPLDEPVAIDEGEKFSVVVTLSEMDGTPSYFFVDQTYQNKDWIKFTNTTSAGQSFQKLSSNSSWNDLNSSGATARIKAFTSDIATTKVEPPVNPPVNLPVNPTINPTGINLNTNTLNMNPGQTSTITATITPADVTDKTITWTSSNSNVANVNSNGLVTGVLAGTATITGTTSNNITANCTVTVINPIVSATQINLNTSSIALKAGETTTLTANISPADTTDKTVTWSSLNGSVATVDSNGQVTVNGVGTTTIIATSANGLTAFCQVAASIGKITGLKAASQSTKSIKLSWIKQNGVSGYVIYRLNPNTKKYVKIATNSKASKNTYTDKSRQIATTYKYKVRAYTKINGKKIYGAYSSILQTATKTSKPSLSLSALSKSAKLKWKKVNGATGYEIYMSTSKSSGYSLIKTITKGKTTSYKKKSLTKKKRYYFKIRAYKKVAGVKIYSSYSKVKSVKVK